MVSCIIDIFIQGGIPYIMAWGIVIVLVLYNERVSGSNHYYSDDWSISDDQLKLK